MPWNLIKIEVFCLWRDPLKYLSTKMFVGWRLYTQSVNIISGAYIYADTISDSKR